MGGQVDLWESLEEYEAVIMYMESEPIHFETPSWKSKYVGPKFTYVMDFGSARLCGLNIGKRMTFTVTNNHLNDLGESANSASKSLIFEWQNFKRPR